MDIRELKGLRNRLLLDQIRVSELIDEKRMEDLEVEELNEGMGCEMVGEVLKITIDDYPPKVNAYERNEIVDGKIVSNTHKKARDRIYSLIGSAVRGYKGERIDPAIVHIVYYVPRICDVGNFVGKMIVDSLMYSGAIGKDDNLEHLPIEISQAIIDKDNPRTEIYVIKYSKELEGKMLPWLNKNRQD